MSVTLSSISPGWRGKPLAFCILHTGVFRSIHASEKDRTRDAFGCALYELNIDIIGDRPLATEITRYPLKCVVETAGHHFI
ncbi:hypothetical protein ACXHXG_20035 [Rhizobium sp. LEGMi198b]